METLVGSVIAYAGGVEGNDLGKWLFCDGSAVSREAYAKLFASIGIAYGGGDGVTTFNLPNYQGQFLRGVSNASNVDPDAHKRTGQVNAEGSSNGDVVGNEVGTFQGDEFRSHTHVYSVFPNGEGGIASGDYWNSGDTNTQPSGGNETRPVNVYVNYLIFTGISH